MFEQENQEINAYDEKIAELDQKARQQELADQDRFEELQKKNHDFVQYDRKSLLVLAKVQAKSGLAGAIFSFFSSYMKRDNKLIVSREALAEYFNCSTAAVSRSIKLLLDSKLIHVYKSGQSNIYCLNADVVWSTSRDKKEFADFSCRVFLSKSEQEKLKSMKIDHVKSVSLK